MQPRAAGGVKIRAMTQIHQQVQLLTIEAEHEGQRIDNFLKTQLKGVPKSLIYRILRKGEVRVNKKRIKPEYKLCAGDEVRVPPVRVAEKNELPSANLGSIQRLESQILFEDEAMIVLNKPSGMAVHGGSGLSFGVIEGLRALRPEARFLELVHRLDRDTSGCLLLAKSRPALLALNTSLKQQQMDKRYLALVAGRWPARRDFVAARLDRYTLANGERRVRVDAEGKVARTRFAVREAFPKVSLLEAEPVTGRTHQIRVHAAHAGHPLLGDDKYGTRESQQLAARLGLSRLFLHAESLAFPEPTSGREVRIRAPLPDDLESVLTRAREAL